MEEIPERDIQNFRLVRLILDNGVHVSTTWQLEKELVVLTIHRKRKTSICWLKLSYIVQMKLSHTESMSESYYLSTFNCVTRVNQDMKYFPFKFASRGRVGWRLNNFENSLQNVMNQKS